jgi:hypothetical protein
VVVLVTVAEGVDLELRDEAEDVVYDQSTLVAGVEDKINSNFCEHGAGQIQGRL